MQPLPRIPQVSIAPGAIGRSTRVTSPEVRETRSRVEGDRRLYELDFQNDVDGDVELTFELDLPHAGEASIPAPAFPDAQRATGFLAIDGSGPTLLPLAAPLAW